MSDQQPPFPGENPGQTPGDYPGQGSYGTPPSSDQGYGQPAGQGFGQYGAPMPPPSSSELGANFSVGAAFSYGWKGFKAHAGPFLGLTLLLMVVSVVISAVTRGADQPLATVLQLVGQVVSILFSVAVIKGALDVVAGRPVSIGSMFEGWDKLQAVIAAVLISIGTLVGILLLVIPGLIWLFLTWYTNYFIVDQQLSAIDSIKASIRFASSHVGPLLVMMVAGIGVILLGTLALVVGLLVAMPVIFIANAYAFRVLQGQPVAQLH